MSDTPDALLLTNVAPPVEFTHDGAIGGKDPCPECGKLFVPGPGMGVHRAAVHGVQSKSGRPRKQCPECEKWFSSKDLARHLRAMHGSETPKRRGRPPGVPNKPKPKEWHVDDIFATVVELMYPSGVIPTKDLLPLLRWRHATDVMLSEVTNGS